jgi:hypothetical protein
MPRGWVKAVGNGGADLGGGSGDAPIQVADRGDELGGQLAQRAWPCGCPKLCVRHATVRM